MKITQSHVFREYDVRGIVDRDFTPEFVRGLGQAFATYVKERGARNAVIGMDCRLSSPELRTGLAEGLTAAGLDVIEIGVVATPLLYFALHTLPDVGAGIQITGSHNPPEYNGFKLCVGKTTLHGEQIQQVRELLERGHLATGRGTRSERSDINDRYVDYVTGNVKLARKLKVVVDGGNGTGGPIAERLYKALGAEVIPLFTEMDGRFPNHHPDPTVDHNLEDVIAKVKATGADLGIAFDGDADRIGAVDEKGEIIRGDKLLLLFARSILKVKPGATIVSEVKCSKVLYDDIAAKGGTAIMWKAGHSLIKAKMQETKAELAGEMSGHIFFANRYFGYDDAVYSGARLLEILAAGNAPLSSYFADLPQTYATPEIRLDCPEEKKFAAAAMALKYFREHYQVVDVDGVRVLFDDGWGLVRASNTQPVLVLRFEATTAVRLAEIRALIEGKLHEFLAA